MREGEDGPEGRSGNVIILNLGVGEARGGGAAISNLVSPQS